MKRIIAALLLLFTVLTLAACKRGEEEQTTAETEEPVYVYPDLTGIPSPLKINGEEIPYSVFRYYYAAVRNKYDRGDASYWDSHDYSADILEEALHYLRHDIAVKEYAAQVGVALSDYERSEIEKDAANMRYYYENDYEYDQALDENYLTEQLYIELSETDKLYSKTFEYLTGEASGYKISSERSLIRKYLDTYVSRADHILILNDPGDDVNENETLINELYKRIKNGEDFEKLKEQYSEDEETNYNSVGYYFTEGDIGKEFEAAAAELERGEMSGVITTHYGYHIIIKLEFDEDYITENWDDYFVPFYQKHMYELGIKKLMNAQQIEYDASYYGYTPKTVK